MTRKDDCSDFSYFSDSSDSSDYSAPKKLKKKASLPSHSAKKKKLKLDEENVSFTFTQNKKPRNQCSILKFYRNYEMGLPCHEYKQPVISSVINYCKSFQLYKVELPFDRRVTFIVWHPTNPRVLAVTSHGGDVLLYNYEQDFSSATFVKGIGAGGSVQNMKFDPLNPIRIYTASMEGKFLVLNFHTKEAKQFLETNNKNRWYISLDVNAGNKVMVAGDTKGQITMLTLDGKVMSTMQVHNKGYKVNHAEFSKRESWLLCTSSTDGSLKLWDIRNMRTDKENIAEPLQTIIHNKPINAAYFSLTDGCRLLTTDQMDRIKIYRAPLWNLETEIHHPHRQFQHLTPIRAYWHPLEDIIFVGRYPHVKFPGYTEDELKTIDFFDAGTGDLLYQHHQSGVDGIKSLNRFNVIGDALASSYGYRFLIWKPNFKVLERISKKQDKKNRNRRSKYNDDDDDDDDSDYKRKSDDIDWEAFLKQQQRDRLKSKKLEQKNVKKG